MMLGMATAGKVRVWHDEEGWGVVDSDSTPGGCWTHFSHVAVPGFRSLEPGQLVELQWEPAQQDGYSYRAVRAWPQGQQPYEAPGDTTPTDGPGAYRSTLAITWDEPPPV
jgi:CspA family cold shock protein